MDTRREFLTKAALLAGTSGLAGGLFSSIQRALAIEPEQGSTFWDAEHVVILMQENRSFDHAFGTLRGVRGYNDPRAIKLANGNPVWLQSNSAGESYLPFRLNIKDTNATWMGSLPHGWTDQTDARNNGRYDRWLDAKRSGEGRYADMPLTLGYYNRDDIPFYYAFADAFTICDQHFCSSLTGTTPNRCYLWSGTIRAQQTAASPANVLNSDADHVTNVSWPTFPERLEDLGVSWKIYQNEIDVGVGFTDEEAAWLANFGDNPVEYFSQFNVRLTPSHREYLESQAKSLPAEIEELKRKAASSSLSSQDTTKLNDLIQEKTNFLKQIESERLRNNQQAFDKLTPRQKNLLTKAFVTNAGDPNYHELKEITYRDGDHERRVHVPKGDILYQFLQDVSKGALPAVSWLVAPERYSDHPSSAWYGAWYIAEVLDILTQNPDVWKKTIFLLTYDENDGYFDHVPPFVSPDPRRPETGRVSKNIDASLEFVARDDEMKRKSPGESRDSSIGLGYRVPLVVASPWSRGGFVCSQVFDHTSPLQLVEKLLSKKLGKELRETNISAWRRAVCGDLTSSFQPGTSDSIERLKYPSRDEFVEQIHRAKFKEPPSDYKKLSSAEIEQARRSPGSLSNMPQQEPGMRPSCSLPYELAVDGKLTDDKRAFDIALEVRSGMFGFRSAGAPFTVYANHGSGDLRVRNYAVTAGDQLEDSWQLAEFPEGRYALAVHGPNGFFREFRGDAHDPPLAVNVEGRHAFSITGALRGLVEIHIHNVDKSALQTIEIIDESYQNKPQQITIPPGEKKLCFFDDEKTFGWYDFRLRVEGNESFSARYAGRVETPRPGYSDPAIGRELA